MVLLRLNLLVFATSWMRFICINVSCGYRWQEQGQEGQSSQNLPTAQVLPSSPWPKQALGTAYRVGGSWTTAQ